ncbi:chitinase-3-like protein 1 [Haemaphysalis longicornis]
MWISWLAQVALLTALHLVTTGHGDRDEGTTNTNKTCPLYNFTNECVLKQRKLNGLQTGKIAPGTSNRSEVRRVCYITLPYYPKPGNYTAHLCTHIIAGFVKTLQNGTLKMVRDTDPEQYQDLINLKSCNPNLKVLVTTGINNYNNRTDSRMFSKLVNDSKGRSDFVNGSLTFLREYGFDGLDVDWEYPGHKTNDPNKTKSPPEDKENFVLLLKELQEAFRNESQKRQCGDLLLSVPVSATQSYIDNGYDIANISKYADLVNVMCYNYHLFHKKKNYTRHNSPLYKNEEELKSPILNNQTREFFSKAYVKWTVDYLTVNLSLNASKMNVGLPVFGRTFELANKANHSFLAPATGPGPGSGGNGFVTYLWVCKFVNQTNTSKAYDNKTVAPYAYNDTVWVAYNEEEAIRTKVEWTVNNSYGGVMTYALNMDDVNNTCGHGHYPIHTLIRNLLVGNSTPSQQPTSKT